jgi:hypothetical protein
MSMHAHNAEKMPPIVRCTTYFLHIGRGSHPKKVQFPDGEETVTSPVFVTGNDKHGGAVLHLTMHDIRNHPIAVELFLPNELRVQLLTALQAFEPFSACG